jgi:hypothetical protein
MACANRVTLLRDVERSPVLLLEHLMYTTRPDCSTPLFGNDDGGRLMPLDQRAADEFRSALATGAVLFKRGDLKFVGNGAAEGVL